MPFSYSDSVVPESIVDAVTVLSSSKSAFFGTGVAVIEESDGYGRGRNFLRRRYGNEDSTAGIPIDGTAHTPAIINATADVAPVLRRLRFRRAVDGSGAAEGGALALNPTQRILDSTIAWWSAEWDRVILAELAAAFDPSAGVLYDTHVHDIATSSGAIAPLSFASVVEGSTLIGDRFRDLAVLVCHSRVAADIIREAGARPLAAPIAGQPFLTDIWVGSLRLVVSDRCPVSGSDAWAKYTSFALAVGSVWAVEQQPIREFVQTNSAIPSIDYSQTWHRAIGLSGLSYNVTTENPADAVLATPASWTLTVDPMTDASRKSVGIVGIVSNAT